MTKIPPEIDRLMWTLVEQDNDQAIVEFSARHPEYRSELMRRASMVVGLKQLRPEAKVIERPPFRPRPSARPSLRPRSYLLVGGLGLAAVGLAAFTISYFAFPHPPLPIETPHVTPSSAHVKPHDQVVAKEPPHAQAPPMAAPTNEEPPPSSPTPPLMKPITLRISSAPLMTVLQAIAAESGMHVVAAPGLANPVIDVSYTNATAMDVLSDLGQHYQFTPFDQGDGSIIIIPAVDPRSREAQHGRIGG